MEIMEIYSSYSQKYLGPSSGLSPKTLTKFCFTADILFEIQLSFKLKSPKSSELYSINTQETLRAE